MMTSNTDTATKVAQCVVAWKRNGTSGVGKSKEEKRGNESEKINKGSESEKREMIGEVEKDQRELQRAQERKKEDNAECIIKHEGARYAGLA